MKNTIDGLISRDTVRKKSLYLKILQQKLPKLKNKEKKDWGKKKRKQKKDQTIQEL